MVERLAGLSLAALLVLNGCTGADTTTEYADAEQNVPSANGHEHEQEGPHGGHILEFSENHEYHGEVCFDADTRDVTLYLLGSDMKTPVPVPATDVEFELEEGDDEVVVALKADPLPGEDATIASKFVVSGSDLPASIHDIEELHAHVHVTIDGTEYAAGLEHGHDGHDHGSEGQHEHDEDGHHDTGHGTDS